MGQDPDLTPRRRGRPRRLTDAQGQWAKRAYTKRVPVVVIAHVLGCSWSTVMREVRRAQA